MNLLALATLLAATGHPQSGANAFDIPAKYLTASPAASFVLARVNGVAITAAEVQPLLWDWNGYQVREDLIDYSLVRQEAIKRHVDVTPAEMDAALADQLKKTQEGLKPGQELDKVLKENGFPKSRLYLRLRAEALLKKLVMDGFASAKFVKVSTVVFRPASEDADAVAAAIKRAQDAYAKLKAGGPWTEALTASGANANEVKNAGLVGWRMIDAFPATVQTDLNTMATGAYTKPAQIQGVIQIFRLDAAGKDAKPEDMAELKDTYLRTRLGPYLIDLRKAAKVEKFDPK